MSNENLDPPVTLMIPFWSGRFKPILALAHVPRTTKPDACSPRTLHTTVRFPTIQGARAPHPRAVQTSAWQFSTK